ncbi:MAG: hypothetical protein DLM58_10700 [Pseudonocardiales bacterium]|nr:MAG: hypothetical protein DLM58_10700 [Pseudonocardiales bacterium]
MTVSQASSLPEHLCKLLAASPKANPRMVIFGNYGNGNLGDEAILSAILATLRYRASVTVMSRRPDRVNALHAIPSANALSVAGVRSLLRADIVAIGGGGIFGNNMALLPRLLPLLALVLRMLGKSIVFVAIGAYTTTPGWIKPLLRVLARTSAMTTVRDAESAQVLGANSIVVPDPGMSIVATPASEVAGYLADLGVPVDATLLAVSLKPAADPRVDIRQKKVATAAIEHWLRAEPSGAVVLLCLSERGDHGHGMGRSDRTLADEVRHGLGDDPRVHLVEADVTPWLMKGVIARCAVVVAHRLHAQMFAVDEGRPLLGMSWERKSDAFLDEMGLPRIDLSRNSRFDVTGWLGAHTSASSTVALVDD